jgi:hypothetical protein
MLKQCGVKYKPGAVTRVMAVRWIDLLTAFVHQKAARLSCPASCSTPVLGTEEWWWPISGQASGLGAAAVGGQLQVKQSMD